MSQNDIVSAQHDLIGNRAATTATTYQRTQHPDAQWFPQALGLFIHWGISSHRGTGDLSWSMMLTPPEQRLNTITRYGPQAVQAILSPNDYWKQAEFFKPDRFDPRKMLQAAKDAGFEYAVFTTKHHDGYTMWPSKVSDFGVQKYLPGQDFVKQYVEACRQVGLKVGLYYSPPDWRLAREHQTFGKTRDEAGNEVKVGVDHQPVDPSKIPSEDEPSFKKIWNANAKGHIYELLQNYGKIDLLWFDGSSKDAVTLEELRELQPGIVFNPRGLGYGDYASSECAFPKERAPGWWEYCHIWNDGAWGYLSHEMYKPIGWMLGEWAKARAWGGAFLPNVGPNGRGELPEVAYRRFAELKEWREKFGHTLDKKLQPGTWPAACNAPVVVDGSTWYVHLGFDWDELNVIVKGATKPTSVKLITGEKPVALDWTIEDGALKIPIKKGQRSVLSDVVEISFAR
jgi:alpha-L-fucosidase